MRERNEDYALCFEIRNLQIVVVADGCGGLPHGQRASYLATVSASLSLLRAFGSRRWHLPDPDELSENAFLEAAHRLAIEADKLNVTPCDDGLRTTLIIVIASPNQYHYLYIGDGGGVIARPSGKVVPFLCPQKADAPNILAASLGPTPHGEPVLGALPRDPGDLLLVGSDGVFDFVESGFANDIQEAAIVLRGDLQKVTQLVLDELVRTKDNAGFICTDNVTLAIAGTGLAPERPSSAQKVVNHQQNFSALTRGKED